MLDLGELLDRPVRLLSLGQRMRCELVAALLHNPKVLYLDEPTIGLDVVAKDRIREFIQHLNHQRGLTIILTTHDIADIEKLCRRVMIAVVYRYYLQQHPAAPGMGLRRGADDLWIDDH